MANLNQLLAGMNVSFKKAAKATATASSDAGKIFFTTDTKEIILAGQSFGKDPNAIIGSPADVYTTGQPTVFSALNKASEAINALTALDDKADLVDGKVPASQLPSYVDDVIEIGVVKTGVYNNNPTFWKADTPDSYCGLDPMAHQEYLANGEKGKFYYAISGHSGAPENVLLVCTGEGNLFSVATTELPADYEAKKGKIYVRLDNNKTYRCSNETTALLVEISASTVYTDSQAQAAVVGNSQTYTTANRISKLNALLTSVQSNSNVSSLGNLLNDYVNGSISADIDIVTSAEGWSANPSDASVPSEKLVAEAVGTVITQLTWG